jgi:hypothetical protein
MISSNCGMAISGRNSDRNLLQLHDMTTSALGRVTQYTTTLPSELENILRKRRLYKAVNRVYPT